MSQINVDTIRNRTGGPPALDQGVVVTGVVTSTEGYFSGPVTIGGTLTYEDVTNIDSTGIITAKSGIYVGNAAAATGIGVTLETTGEAQFTGIITAAQFVDSNGVGISTANVSTSDFYNVGVSTLSGNATVGSAISMYAATGIVSCTEYWGSGANLSDIVSGIALQSSGSDVSSGAAATMINFSGSSISISNVTAGFSTVTITAESWEIFDSWLYTGS